MMYGNSSPDADVLEDESDSALWCWEVCWVFLSKLMFFSFDLPVLFTNKLTLLMHMQIRDLKLMPVKARSILSTRRSVRKKIHERITAIYCKENLVLNYKSHQAIFFVPASSIICILHFAAENG
jgi:chromatin assembly factor 1 subunit A